MRPVCSPSPSNTEATGNFAFSTKSGQSGTIELGNMDEDGSARNITGTQGNTTCEHSARMSNESLDDSQLDNESPKCRSMIRRQSTLSGASGFADENIEKAKAFKYMTYRERVALKLSTFNMSFFHIFNVVSLFFCIVAAIFFLVSLGMINWLELTSASNDNDYHYVVNFGLFEYNALFTSLTAPFDSSKIPPDFEEECYPKNVSVPGAMPITNQYFEGPFDIDCTILIQTYLQFANGTYGNRYACFGYTLSGQCAYINITRFTTVMSTLLTFVAICYFCLCTFYRFKFVYWGALSSFIAVFFSLVAMFTFILGVVNSIEIAGFNTGNFSYGDSYFFLAVSCVSISFSCFFAMVNRITDVGTETYHDDLELDQITKS
eukprot:Nk52_evm1s2367 gene=Nk52_evmTU1s2367